MSGKNDRQSISLNMSITSKQTFYDGMFGFAIESAKQIIENKNGATGI
jgi:hypothetical protein